MKRTYAICMSLLALLLLLTGCGKKTNQVSQLDLGDSRFLMVTLEGDGADNAVVEAVSMVFTEEKQWKDVETIALIPGENNIYCALLNTGGNYRVQVTYSDETSETHLVVFDDSQVCRLTLRKPAG